MDGPTDDQRQGVELGHGTTSDGLLGRATEVRLVDDLLSRVRSRSGAVLVVTGPPGIGKTSLLRQVTPAPADVRTLSVVGVESERRMGYAGLHRLLLPHLNRVSRLPVPQRAALSAAFGLVAGSTPDRFLIGLAALTLLADVAEGKPLLCIVDDAQWLDPESLEALAFVGRRLHVDRIGLLIALRDSEAAENALRGLPTVRLGGLSSADVRALLSRSGTGRLDDAVANRIATETGGNPLAVLTLAEALSEEQLAGRMDLPITLPAGGRLEQWFLAQVATLPRRTQLLLLVAALAAPDDPATLWRAAGHLGLAPLDADPAIAEGVLQVGRGIAFRHPLIRSAVYAGASATDRRRAHTALATAITPGTAPERRAWHLAAAATGTDDDVADELERAAEHARSRGGYATWAALLARSADLTTDPATRAARSVASTRAHLYAGNPQQAQALLDRSVPESGGPVVRARAEQVRAALCSYRHRMAEVPAMLLRALADAGTDDEQLTRDLLWDAMRTAVVAGQSMVGCTQADVARAALHALAALGPGPADSDRLLRAFAVRIAVGHRAAVPLFREAVTALSGEAPVTEDAGGRALLAALAADELWDDHGRRTLLERIMRFDREHGDLNELCLALRCSVAGHVRAGRFAEALACQEEAAGLTAAMGMPATGDADLAELWAWQGRAAEARAAADTLAEVWAGTVGMGVLTTVGRQALCVLELGLGRYARALQPARQVFDEDAAAYAHRGLADLVEAGVRADDRAAAEAGLARLAERAPATGTPWALGLLARARALLAAADEAEEFFEESLAELARTDVATELARTQLTYGEWLRRCNRRIDARAQLRQAYEAFEGMGAAAFAERARGELLASGVRLSPPATSGGHGLTPQEGQVARLAADGATNAEIATRLFVTVSTVEYHMNKVLRKLDVSSRRQLAAALAGPRPARNRPASRP